VRREIKGYGHFDYKMPGLIEAMDYMHILGLDLQKFSDSNYIESNIFLYLGKVLKGMQPFVTNIEVKVDEELATDFEGLMTLAVRVPEIKEAVMEVAQEIFTSLAGGAKKA
jgi:hypothetical protein